MRNIRIVCWILSVILIAVGFVAGLHEMSDEYERVADQLQYALGSTLAMLLYVAGVWALYGIAAGIRLIVLRQRQHRQQSAQTQ